jgi:hypothetical protein
MKELTGFKFDSNRLTPMQEKVLSILYAAYGPLSRTKIAVAAGQQGEKYLQSAATNLPIGWQSEIKRAEHEQRTGATSLLTLGLVTEMDLDIDGLVESVIDLTETGLSQCEELFGNRSTHRG